jgi:hypothetical protein
MNVHIRGSLKSKYIKLSYYFVYRKFHVHAVFVYTASSNTYCKMSYNNLKLIFIIQSLKNISLCLHIDMSRI